MKIFETDRLLIKTLEPKDERAFIELVSDPRIISPIPQPQFSEEYIQQVFFENLNLQGNIIEKEKCVCAIFEKGNPEAIGLSLFLKNDEQDYELGYRFLVDAWGKGYGTETAKGMIDYYLKDRKVGKVTADVNVENIGSVKILSKLMNPVREFFDIKNNCTNRRYAISLNQKK